MSNKVDIKIAHINKLENNDMGLDRDKVHEVFQANINEKLKIFYRLQQDWVNRAYKNFNDFDTYLILMYLMNKVYINYSDRFHYMSMEAFYSQEKVGIEKINLIEISKDLNIPKETIRRKVNFLQDQNIIFRKGKAILFNNQINRVQRPANSKKMMAGFLEKTSLILEKEQWFGKSYTKDEIEAFIDKYFTICWQHWFRLQIPFLVRHRTFFGDLETWNVWGAIGISQFTDYSKQVKNRVVDDPRTYSDLYLHLLRHTPKNGINASSISEISTIPRATVIRKLKYLVKQKLVTKNKKLEYMLLPSPKNIKSFEQNYMHNQKHKAGFVTTIFDLMKNSSFKID